MRNITEHRNKMEEVKADIASTATPPELTISADGHKIFAVMGITNKDNKRTIAIHRLPRQFLHMDEDEQKWFLNSQGVAKTLLKKLGIK